MRHVGLAIARVACAIACTISCVSCTEARASNGAESPGAKHSVAARNIVITAHDYAYTGMPARVPAGWLTLKMVNGGHELHMLAIAHVPRGFTAASLIDSLIHNRYIPPISEVGGPNVISSGNSAVVTVFAPAGEYVYGCFVISPDGKLHVAKGMFGSFTAVAGKDVGARPSSDESVTLTTYRVAAPATITRGTHTILVHDGATERHDMAILRIKPGHSVAEALKWLDHPDKNQQFAEAIGGTTAVDGGGEDFVTADFTPGDYLFLCILSTDKNKNHYDLGMKQLVTVPST